MTKRFFAYFSTLFCVFAIACTPTPLTWRNSTPCPSSAASIETWCDDLGTCEYRVTTGHSFRCSAGDSEGCTRALSEASAACQSGGVPDGGVLIPSACDIDVPCVDDGQCTAIAGTSCNTNTRRCQTVLCGTNGVSCSNETHCAHGLTCVNGRCAERTYTYFIASLSIPEPTGAPNPRAFGFNLDRLNSTGECTSLGCVATCVDLVPDYVSATDFHEEGIDNAFATLVPTFDSLSATSLDEVLTRQISSGEFVILLDVTGVDREAEDSEVFIQLYAGSVPAGQTLESRVFDVTPLGSSIRGSITNRQLRFSVPELSLPILVGTDDSMLRIRGTEWRADIAQGQLTNGIIGGAINVLELAQTMAVEYPGLEETFVEVFGSNADLMPSPSDPTQCESISIGMTFLALPAEISGR